MRIIVAANGLELLFLLIREVAAGIAGLIWFHVAMHILAKRMQLHKMRFTAEACGPIALNLCVRTLPRVACWSSVDESKNFRHNIIPRGDNLKQGVIGNLHESVLNWIVELEAMTVFAIVARSDLRTDIVECLETVLNGDEISCNVDIWCTLNPIAIIHSP